jgi:hypothetical protein
MIRHQSSQPFGTARPGKTLIMFALLLPVLLGMVGMTLDSGLLQSTYRQTQNAADAAALAAALDLYNGYTKTTATTTATTYVQTYNNMSGATVTINIPPLTGPNAGDSTYAEAIISYPYKTSFIQFLGISKSQTVTARAVGGFESVPAYGVMALLPNGQGVSVTGGVALKVDGTINDNYTNSSSALSVTQGANIYANSVLVSGGASIGAGSVVSTYPSGGGGSPLTQNTGVQYADPLASMPVPTTSNGVVNTNYGTLSGSGTNQTLSPSSTPGAVYVNNGHSATLYPGIYQTINIAGGSAVTFQPGIYVLAGGGLTISNGATISGSGVMFYNTASTYNPITGVNGASPTFGSINMVGGTTFSLGGITTTGSPFNGVLFFQDRANTQTLYLNNGSTVPVTGTFYAPTATFQIAGGGTYDSQFIVGSFVASNGSTMTITPPAGPATANQVFLVE